MSTRRTLICVDQLNNVRRYYGPSMKPRKTAAAAAGSFDKPRQLGRALALLAKRPKNKGARLQVVDVQTVQRADDPAVWTDWVDLNLTPAELENLGNPMRVARNSRYLVMVNHAAPGESNHLNGDPPPNVVHLSIKRHDQEPFQDWRDLQRIKNELVGPENEAVQLYPRESRLVDAANQVHLWVFTSTKISWPIGWVSGRVVTSESMGGATQRPRDEDDPIESTVCAECLDRVKNNGPRVAALSPCASCGRSGSGV